MSRYFRGRARRRPQIRGTEDLIRYCRLEMGHLKEEQFRVIYLNTRNCIIRDEVLQEGTVDRAEVYPRKILERALQYKASAMILVHNHPGGSLRPSPQDVKLTERVVRSARELDMVVHDHMIVAGEGVFSFREEGLLPVK